MRSPGILQPIHEQACIKQKSLEYSPAEKFTDAFY